MSTSGEEHATHNSEALGEEIVGGEIIDEFPSGKEYGIGLGALIFNGRSYTLTLGRFMSI